jgi:hypothetical protein
MGGPPGSWLGVGLTSHLIGSLLGNVTQPRNWMDSSKRRRQRQMDIGATYVCMYKGGPYSWPLHRDL